MFVLSLQDGLLKAGYGEQINRMYQQIPKVTSDGRRLQVGSKELQTGNLPLMPFCHKDGIRGLWRIDQLYLSANLQSHIWWPEATGRFKEVTEGKFASDAILPLLGRTDQLYLSTNPQSHIWGYIYIHKSYKCHFEGGGGYGEEINRMYQQIPKVTSDGKRLRINWTACINKSPKSHLIAGGYR